MITLAFFCPSSFAGGTKGLREIYETPIPAKIRKDFDQAIETYYTCDECMLGFLDAERFINLYQKKFIVLELLPNSSVDICAFIAIEGERNHTYRLLLDRLPGGEYDLRSIEELPNSMDEKFFTELNGQDHDPYWR